MLYQFLLTFTPLVLGAVQSSECTVDISILPSVWGIFFIVIYFWHTLLVSLFILNVISLSYKIPFFQLFMFFLLILQCLRTCLQFFLSVAVNELPSLNLLSEIFCIPISFTRFLFDPPLRLTKVNPGFQARLQFFVQTEIQVRSPWPLKFLRWVFIYSFFISSPVIVIFPDHRKFLAFAWDLGTGIFRYFLLCVLPFGLLSASLKPLQKSRRSKGIPITIFLDFGLGGGGAYRVQGQNLQFADCPCRFA